MSKFNLLFFLNTYGDKSSSNQPNFNNFKWTREISGLQVSKPLSQELTLAPGESRTIFDGTRSLSHDGTTVYSLELKIGTSSTYTLSHVSGTAPQFRTPRTSGADATTQVTVTQNGPLLTFTSTGGTALSLISGGVIVGDYVRIGDIFDINNQGQYKILSLTATSLTIENDLGVPESSITLGVNFLDQLKIYSASGVQIGDVLNISGGFSPVSQRSYSVTSVANDFIEFLSLDILPQETSIMTNSLAIYSNAKQFVYLEADKKCSMIINNIAAGNVQPFLGGNKPGIFVKTDSIWSFSITNQSTDSANIYIAAIE